MLDQSEDHEQSSERIDEFSSFIKKEINNLILLMTTQFGLLEELESNNVLTSMQVSFIQDKDSYRGQVRKLFEEITRDTISAEKLAFLRELDLTLQKHVSNFIRDNGERAAEYGDHWPLCYCTEFTRLATQRSKLIDLIDTRNSLLDEMLSANSINTRQIHYIEEGATDEIQSEILLAIVLWGSLAP